MSGLVVAVEDPDTLDGRRLVRELWSALGRLYGDNGPCRFTPADLQGPGGAFVVARLDGVAVGCGGIRPLAPGVVEIKRMFTRPEARRRGVARAVLGRLEREAVALGNDVARLETGVRQPEAIALYRSVGYTDIEPWGAYVGDPLSVCLERRLARGGER